MMRATFGCLLGLAGLVGVVSCSSQHRSASAVGTTQTTGGAIVPSKVAVQYVAATRCNREHVCNQIGAGKRYDSVEDCTRDSWRDTHAELGVERCPNGVNESALDKCLYDLGTQVCSTPVANVQRVATCRRQMLCL
ncbi:DUF6184 family natural product biosynthesis lipoprotein [Pendulispora rubella]|uniref:DUF6184 family natural product biosynthesis lipoprotein n=2 Tax=Pendulispora rubella TaxID=2741070 RepID=A0ABZ2LFI1_9BACT